MVPKYESLLLIKLNNTSQKKEQQQQRMPIRNQQLEIFKSHLKRNPHFMSLSKDKDKNEMISKAIIIRFIEYQYPLIKTYQYAPSSYLKDLYQYIIFKEIKGTMSLISNKVGSKYLIGPKIGSGSFGEVYAVSLMGTNQIYALKREDQKSKNSQILNEYKILKQIQDCVGFAKVYWQGTQNKFNQFVMDMLGPSLEDLFQICGKSFSLKTTIMIADQMIQRIQDMHNRNYIHRDIKPQNFLMGIGKQSHIVHLIDFGLSKKYRDSKTLQHIPYKQNKNLTGTARYASINAHLGIQQSRRDDLQAIGYVILYLRQGFLPWQGIKANNKNEKYQKIMEKKMSIPIEVQCKGLPLQISTFITYCRSLKFNDKPDYNFLRKMLRELMEREGHKFDYCYDWTILEQDKSLDNGKIKIQLKSTIPPQKFSNDPLKVNSPDISPYSQMKYSRIGKQNNPRGYNQNLRSQKQINQNVANSQDQSEQNENLLIGEENINESGMIDENQYQQTTAKNVDRLIDFEDKKNQMYDEQDYQ